jgi:hypothetical protein
MNGTAFTAGRIGRAFLFDGIDDYVQVADQSVNASGADQLEAWMQTREWLARPARSILVANRPPPNSPSNGYGSPCRTRHEQFRALLHQRHQLGRCHSEFVEHPVTINTWNHVVATYDLTTCASMSTACRWPRKLFTTAISHTTAPLVMGGSATAGSNWIGASTNRRFTAVLSAPLRCWHAYNITNSGNNGLPAGI